MQNLQIIQTSTQRYNCAFHASLLGIFNILLSPDVLNSDAEEILNGSPFSFIAYFNNIHNSKLTVVEFMRWVRSHGNGTTVNTAFIQSLAPTLRMMVYDLHERKALSREITTRDFKCENADSVRGMQSEATFNYIYAIFGIPVSIREVLLADSRQILDSSAHEALGYVNPDKQQDGKYIIYIHQDNGKTHFSAQVLSDAPNCLEVSDVRYNMGKGSPLLAALGEIYGLDPVQIAAQEDINAFFRAERCQLIRSKKDIKVNYVAVATYARSSNGIKIEDIRAFFPSSDEQDLQIILRWVNAHILQKDINKEALMEAISTPTLRYDRVIVDILMVISIIGMYHIVNRDYPEHGYYFSPEKTTEEFIKILETTPIVARGVSTG